MGFIYTKEMIEGVRSSRKIFGIPVYKREDSKDGAVKRKYFMGIWSTFSDRYQKCYYFLGLRILKRKNLSGWNYEQDKQLKNLENIVNEQRNEIQNVLKSIGQMHNKLIIPYSGNMELESGKYYSQGGVTYLCNRDTGQAVFQPLADLVGIYVEIVE